MAVAILDAWTLVSTSTDAPGSKTVSAGSNRVLFYKTILRSGLPQAVTSVTYGGQAMTLVIEGETNGAGNDPHASFWVLGESGIQAATSTNFAITREDTNGVRYRASAAVYQHVDQVDPIVDAFATTAVTSLSPAEEAIDTVDNGFVVAAMSGADSVPSGQDVTWDNMTQVLENGDNVHYESIAHLAVNASTFTPLFTLINSGNSVHTAMSLRAAITTVAMGIASETDDATAGVRPPRTLAFGLASETDSALAMVVLRGSTANLASETDTALEIRPAKGRTTALLTETDTALPMTHARGATVNPAEETETAFAIGHSINRAIGLTTETDTAFAFAHVKAVRLGIASEADTAASVEPIVSTGARLLNGWALLSSFVDSPGTLTVLPGADRWIFYKVTIRDGVPQEVTGVTYGGQPMVNLVTAKTNGSGADLHSSVWGLNEAGIQAATSNAFAITRTGTIGVVFRAHAATYQGADQVNPIVDSFSAVGNNGVAPVPETLATLDRGIVVTWLSGADQAVGGAQDAIWSNVIERLETQASTIYMSVAAIGTDGLDITPQVTLSNQTNTILQGVVLSPVTPNIFIPVGIAQEIESPLAIGANEPVIDLVDGFGTGTDGTSLTLTGLDPAADVRALVVAFTIILDQSAATTSEDLNAVTVTYGGTALRRLDTFASIVDKDRAFLAAFALDRPLLVPDTGDITITVDLGGDNFEAIAAVAAFIRGPEQLLVGLLDQSETLLPALSITDSGVAAASGLVLGFTAAAGLATMAGDVLFGERVHERQLEAANTSVSLLMEERRGASGGAFFRTTTIDAATHMRSIALQVTKVADVDVAVGLSSETSTAEAFTHSKLRSFQITDSTETALSIVPLRTRAIGIAEETDITLPIFANEITTIGFASETDAALSITPVRIKPFGLASEVDLALGVQVVNASKVVRAQNWTLVTSAAVSAVAGVPFTTQAGANRVLLVAIGEDSSSHEPTAVTYGGVAMTLLTNPITASPGGFPLTLSIWAAFESQLAAALDNIIDVTTDGLHNGGFRLYAAVYHNVRQSSQPIDYDVSTGNDVMAAARTIDVRARGMAIAMWGDGDAAAGVNVTWTNVTEQIETNAAGNVYFSIAEASTNHGTLTITPTSAVPGSNALIAVSLAAFGRNIQVNQVEEVQAAFPVATIKTRAVNLSTSTETALPIAAVFRGKVILGLAAETDVALPMEVLLERTIKPARETDQALNINPVVLLTSTPSIEHDVRGDLNAPYNLVGAIYGPYDVDAEIQTIYRIGGRL